MSQSFPIYPDSTIANLEKHFQTLEDPRTQDNLKHNLIDILLITICAVICGANNWYAIETYGHSKLDWLKTFLELPHGIPSHDTFSRLFARINPEQLQSSFLNWIQELHSLTPGELLNFDGKNLRGAKEKGLGKSFIHLVTVWSSDYHLVLGQSKVEQKSNEITAIPKLLKLLTLKNCLITIDAMGCQKEIAQTIMEEKADYVLALKGNHGNLYEDVKGLFKYARQQKFKDIDYQYHETINQGHGREEIRRFWTMENTEYLIGGEEWKGLKSIGMVESECLRGGQIYREQRFYLLSIPSDALRFAKAVRGHWSIENNLHWVLDVGFNEDRCRGTQGYSAENLAVIRHIAVNLLSQERSVKLGTMNKRLKAGWDNRYLQKVLQVKVTSF